MKNYWFGLLGIVLVLAGCEQKSDVDNNDPVAGAYQYETEGEMNINGLLPEFNPTLPLTTTGVMKIEKIGNTDTVIISGAFKGKLNPIKAVLNGDQLEFLGDDFGAKDENFELSWTPSNRVASLVNDTLRWEDNDVRCEGVLYGLDIEGSGYIRVKAYKQTLK